MLRPYVVPAESQSKQQPGAFAAAILLPPNSSIDLARLFNTGQERLYVIQSDLESVSPEMLAGLEWAAVRLGIDCAIVLGNPALRGDLALQMAPHGMQVVNGVIGPNEVVRFEPRLGSGRLDQMCRSRKTV